MIFTPASTSSSASPWAALRGHGEHADDDVLVLDDLAQLADVAHRPGCRPCVPTLAGSTSKIATTRKPWSAKISEEAIALPRWPGADQRDVVLAGGAQDLADLRDERLDVVADAALAELAEARQVAADLGRVDVRVVRELLRGDRLLAHLLGLREHLQVARQARRHAERQPLARRPAAVALGLHRRSSSVLRSSSP